MNRMMKTGAIVVSLCAAVSMAQASPLFSIGEGGIPWNAALTGPLPGGAQIRAVDPNDGDQLTGAALAFYESQSSPFQLVQSNIAAAGPVNLNGEEHDALLMEWDPADMNAPPQNLNIAAWEYVYGVDPDLSNALIHFSVGVPGPVDPVLPPPIWDVSLELIDANGGSAGWFWPGPVPGWSEHWINPEFAGDQGPFLYFEDPVLGFDITQVIAIRLDEAGTTVTFPPVPPPGGLWDWNVWNHLSVKPAPLPEPATFALAGLGLLACSGRRRRGTR